MTKLSTIIAASALLGFAGSSAFAAGSVTKTWVSSTTGNDTGTCQFTAPCKTFAYAITQTLPGGELDVKDAGSYGPVTITQAISIVNVGFLAQISVPSGGTGIAVGAGTSDVVVIRGLTIDGHGVGQNGIAATQALQLIVQDCLVQGVTGVGIAADSAGHLPLLIIANVTAQNNNIGVRTTLSISGIINASIVNSRFSHNASGLVLHGGNADVKNSNFEFNTGYGIDTDDSLTVGNSTFFFDSSSRFQGPSYSYGDNDIREYNGISGTLITSPKQ